MDKARKAQIDWCLNNETNDPETQEWRDELTPEELLELKTFGDHCRVRLRSGEQYMARLGKDGGLVLERA